MLRKNLVTFRYPDFFAHWTVIHVWPLLLLVYLCYLLTMTHYLLKMFIIDSENTIRGLRHAANFHPKHSTNLEQNRDTMHPSNLSSLFHKKTVDVILVQLALGAKL